MIYAFLFWLIIQLLALLALPLAVRIFRWLPDRGYTFAKALGLLVASYLLWLGASLNVLKNDLGGILFAFLTLAALSGWLLYRERQVQVDLLDLLQKKIKLVLTVEVLFTACFILWAVLRAYAPDKIMSAGGEKFMEIAFLNGILNSQHFPPLDPWLSGFAISYYYFGYVMMALLTRLSGAPSGIAFDLYDALLFALTAQGAFGVVVNLAAARLRSTAQPLDQASTDRQPRGLLGAGLLGALLVVGIGNLQGFFEMLYTAGVLPMRFWEWLAIPDMLVKPVTGSWYPGGSGGWWWWTASRVIQDVVLNYQKLGISPITEFPFFSFLLGDNHPHALALPFVLMAIGLAFNLLLRWLALPATPAPDSEYPASPIAWRAAARTAVFEGDWLLFACAALLLGGLAFLNTWDFPIYLGLVVLAWVIADFSRRRLFDIRLLQQALALGAGLLIASILPYTFFYISFQSQAGGVLPYIFSPTRLPQYLVMFGVQIFLVAAFLLANLSHANHNPDRPAWLAALRYWGYVILACLLLLAIVLGVVSLSVVIQSARGSLNPSVLSILGDRTLAQAITAILLARLREPWLFLLLTGLLGLVLANFTASLFKGIQVLPGRDRLPNFGQIPSAPAHLFLFLLIFTGLALTFIVEFVYLRDGFGVRMNTIFKFYYQGWIMLSCASAYALWWLFGGQGAVLSADGSTRKPLNLLLTYTVSLGALLLILASLVYPVMAFHTRVYGFNSTPNLDGASGIARSNPDDWAAIEWLQVNVVQSGGSTPVPTILEAPGQHFASYVYEGRISAFTGLPTLLGWPGHENQWRGSYAEPGRREPDIQTIFTSHDGKVMLDLLHKWDIKYVIIGLPEQRYLVELCSTGGLVCNPTTALRKFELFLQPAFIQGQVTIYQVP